MPTQIIKVPPSETEQTIEIEIPDTVNHTAVIDIPNSFPFKVTGTTAPGETDPPPVPEPVAGYEITAQELWEKVTDLKADQIGVRRETDSLAPYFSTSIVKNSTGSFKSTVPAGGNNLSNGNRSEQQYNDTAHNPKEGAIEYWAYYENWDASRGHSGHTFQFHPHTGGASAIISLQNYSGKFEVVKSIRGVNTRIHNVSKSVVGNTWIHHRWEYKLSSGNDGYWKLFIDGDKVCDYKGQTADGSGEYLKIGQNKWGTMASATVVYYDSLKIYALKK